MDKKGVGAVAILAIVGLVAGGVGFLPVFEHNLAVQEGEPTSAVVQSTDIDVQTDDEGDESYAPVVVYEYTVDGVTYESDNAFPGRFTRHQESRSWAENVVAQYDPGDQVTIHYMPHDPGNAYLRNDGMPGTWFVGIGYAVVAALGGGWLIWKGFRRWKQRRLIADTPTERVRSLSMGRSELKGSTTSEVKEPLSAPFSDDDCVVAKYEIEQYEEDNDDDGGGSWTTVEQGVRYVPFHLEDETGAVLVEPHDDAIFDLDPDDWTTEYVDSSDRGPSSIQQFVHDHEDVSFPTNASGKENDRKYKQNLIRPQESVYVFGTAQPRDGVGPGASNEERLVVTLAGDDAIADGPMFMISDDSEKSLVDRRKWALWRAPIGGCFLVVALSIVLGTWGPSIGLTLPILF